MIPISAMLPLLLFVLSLFVEVNHVPSVGADNAPVAAAATGCVDGHTSVWVTDKANVTAVLHEAINAASCVRYGRLTNLPEHPYPATFREAREIWPRVSWYCWAGRSDYGDGKPGEFGPAEWSACYGAHLAIQEFANQDFARPQ